MSSSSQRLTRRRFLQTSAATAAVLSGSPLWLRAANSGTKDKVNVAHIGASGKGRDDIKGVTDTGLANIVALCDVDAHSLADAAKAVSKNFPGVKTWTDWREMLEKQKDIDAVVVTIPDHCHAVAAMRAIRMGKHVYCQKPLTHDVYEARQLTRAAREHKVATQMGNQGHASPGQRRQVDWIRQGAIGAVKEVHVWTNRPIWPQGHVRPYKTVEPPAHVNWDLWLGPAPARPYAAYTDNNEAVYHPFRWRGFWDFGTGALGDMACHLMDAPFWALKLTGSCSIEAQSEDMTDQTAPKWSVITYQFPQRGDLPPTKMVWYDGGKFPELYADLTPDQKRRYRDGGCVYVGEKGSILGSSGSQPILLGEKPRDFTPPPQQLPTSPGHYVEWLQAAKEGKPELALDNFDHAGPLTETVLLGNLALRLGKRIDWDAKTLKAVNAPEADQLIRREYRKGWEL